MIVRYGCTNNYLQSAVKVRDASMIIGEYSLHLQLHPATSMLVSRFNIATVVHSIPVLHARLLHHHGMAVWRLAKALISIEAHDV